MSEQHEMLTNVIPGLDGARRCVMSALVAITSAAPIGTGARLAQQSSVIVAFYQVLIATTRTYLSKKVGFEGASHLREPATNQVGIASRFFARVKQMTMLPVRDFASAPELGYEEWRAVVRSIVGRHNPEGIEPNVFTGRVLIQSLFGFCADLWDHNAQRIERTRRDVRLDDVEYYNAAFQVVGRSTILQNDEKVTLDVGDVALVDSTGPVTFLNDAPAQWLSLQLPRRSLISHLGQEPRGGSGGRRGTRAGHLLYQLVLNEFKDGSLSTPTGVYMQLAVYDLIGELFSRSDPNAISP